MEASYTEQQGFEQPDLEESIPDHGVGGVELDDL